MSREQYATGGARLAIGPWPYSRDDPCAIRPAGLGPGSDGSGRRRVVGCPPSPFRKAARYAARDGTGDRCRRRAGCDERGAPRLSRRPANAARHEGRAVLGAVTGGEDSNVIVIMVRDVMTRRLVTIGPETPCDAARRLMDEHRIRHLPVVAGGRLVGMVSDRDVRPAGSQSPGTVAGRIMTPDSVTVTSETRVEHAARLMFDARFGSLPVADGNALVGIVPYTDLLRAFVQVLETATQERIAVDFSGGR